MISELGGEIPKPRPAIQSGSLGVYGSARRSRLWRLLLGPGLTLMAASMMGQLYLTSLRPPADRIVDFYGMVENIGVIYPDCKEGNKHVPSFGEIVVRNPLTLHPVAEGERGIVQVCSVLPASYPGHLLLTEDIAEIVTYDGCGCGRRGTCFRFVGRVPKAELRGCGNIERQRRRAA